MQATKCNAKTRSGQPCRNFPVTGRKRCRMHGGKSRKGTDHPNFRHGIYSEHAGESLKKIIEQLSGQHSEDLINPEAEINLMRALILASEALKKDFADLEDLERITKIVDKLVFAKQRSQRILIEQQRLIPVSDVERFLEFMETLLIREVDEETAMHIIHELKTFKISE